ncbi:nucleoside triphosphate pyrophosphohydrolase [Sphingomonas jatrophae]|uniref:Predicted house-cleaning noncanonical NTP pyrophosphatase, all-alpha NTP-PPase (MazG) superfamily n=1 Tax=Sphingomonas jatrophae TaxID=1166337 RepID=A0A1I6L154_9SPHN|nr:nucleoside triphosphate pyrophosphohydrolase [Sphingomonas jatrophae]SFR97199.1 Predicted house-cleaning noncanonical NTP pyrophosphatase, all-alpha NTP-PPase (MazG) superfamily [Sphingomonas jatrophae]
MRIGPTEALVHNKPRLPGLLLHPGLAHAPASTQFDYFTTILHYGTKVAGLQILPPAWVPPYVALPAWLSQEWANDPAAWKSRLDRKKISLGEALRLVSDNGSIAVIVRSSAVGEGLEDRGLYKSLRLEVGASVADLTAAMETIFRHFSDRARHSGMGICIHRYTAPDLSGHVSNEVHLSATRNQWKYFIEEPLFSPERGLNSKFAQAPDEQINLNLASPLKVGGVLRRVCHWINVRVGGRSHLEWCASNGKVWIVQLDQESPTSAGANPHVMPSLRHAEESTSRSAHGDIFTLYRVQDDPPWRKLRNIRDFWTGSEPPRHQLFFAGGDELAALLVREDGAAALASEIDRLTGGRAVLRTDCKDPKVKSFNLPRTHTVNGETAARWVSQTLSDLSSGGVAQDDIAIIVHRYIPARAAAWSYYSPGDDIVRVDCLWGLPDGLQFLSHDSFQLDARTGEELAADVRFKPDFLQEQNDGSWRYVQVARQYGRDRTLSREALRFIALETVSIARKIKDRAQVMWFCDLPATLGLGQHLPWYRSREFVGFEAAKRPPLPTCRVRNETDLNTASLRQDRFIIWVAPEVELVRDDDRFLDRVILLAQTRSLPVEVAGSVLGHAYYRLRAAGILVLVPHPKYPRVRGRHRHYKVVRDAIPQSIAAKGERVSAARLSRGENRAALIGKLFEEGLELSAAATLPEQLEELSDVLEVVRGLASTSGIEWEDLVSAATEKRLRRGGFEHQTVLLETARPMPSPVRADSVVNQESQPLIQLRDLGAVHVEGGNASISFSKLLSSSGLEVELTVEGRPISLAVALKGAGLRLVASGPQRAEDEPDSQLPLF